MSKPENAFDKLLLSVSKMYKKNAELKNCCKSSPILSPAKPIVKQLLDTLETENAYLQKCCNGENNPMENNPFERYGISANDAERGSGTRRKSRHATRRHRKKRTKHRRKKKRKTKRRR
jgi:hypothetical protein